MSDIRELRQGATFRASSRVNRSPKATPMRNALINLLSNQ